MIRCAIVMAAFFTVNLNVFAQDKQGPLADLPSKPGAHIEKIKAMGDNEWLNLGVPFADPKRGKARGSAWGVKALILAPDKRGAFLFGEGVHAYVKPDGYIMDDLWFYDINKHAWLCLYPGTNTKTFTQRVKDKQLLIDENGQLIDNDKQPIPVHTLVHAWGYLAYDSDRKKFAFVSWSGNPIPRYFLGGEKTMDEGLKLLEEQMKGKKKSVFSPWFYDVASGRFERSPTTNPTAINAGGFPQLHYLSSKKQFLAVGSGTVAFFDPAKNLWTDAKPKGPAPKGAFDITGRPMRNWVAVEPKGVESDDVDGVRAAADGAILDVLLARPCRQVDGHDDLLAAGIAGVAGLVFHRLAPPDFRSSPCRKQSTR